jgi:hypothetical protein
MDQSRLLQDLLMEVLSSLQPTASQQLMPQLGQTSPSSFPRSGS